VRPIIERPPPPGAPTQPLWRRLAWLITIAVGAGLSTALAAYGMKALLPPH
jgi:uncharacterized protein involved in exopolysaccharide biosynthesis